MSHIPHITIKTLLTKEKSQLLINMYQKEYTVSFENGIYYFKVISYDSNKLDKLPASGFYCSIKNLELDHKGHMRLHYKFNNSVINKEYPKNLLGYVCIVNTESD